MSDLESGNLSIGSIRTRIVTRFVESANADSGWLFDRRSAGRFHATGTTGAAGNRDQQELLARQQPSDRLCKWLAANELCLRVPDDTAVTSYLPPEDLALLQQLSVRLIVPLIAGARLPGMLLLSSDRPDWHASEDLRASLCAAGRAAGAALERAHVRDAEHEGLQAQHHAQQLTMAGRLAAEVAHEVRNPLAAIRLTIQSILESNVEPDVRAQHLQRMLGEVDRIQDTVSRLLHLARPDELTVEDLNLAEVAAVSVDVIRSLASRNGVRVEADLTQPLLVRADRAEMQKVFLNLLMNACQAMPTGGTLRVAADIIVGPAPDRRAFGRVTVADTGSGVAQDWLNRAFEPFFTTKKTGTGLGLPVSLDIVTRHNGRLELANGNSTGAVATVLLPLRDERDTDV
jgi:signal transduction histidine kinase